MWKLFNEHFAKFEQRYESFSPRTTEFNLVFASVGPDAATSLMVASAVTPLAEGDPQRYFELVVTITLVTGLFHVIFGLCRSGFIANFLSQPILIGYLNGVALIILIGQFPKIFSYQSDGGEFFTKIIELFTKRDTYQLPTALLGIAAIMALLLMKRFSPRLPAALIITALANAIVWLLNLQESGIAPSLSWCRRASLHSISSL